MEYKLFVQRIEQISPEEKEERAREKGYKSYEGFSLNVGSSEMIKLFPVLDVVLTEEEYMRMKLSIIGDKK